jgi:Response receiver domain
MPEPVLPPNPTYTSIAKQIVKDSIRSAICIDDLFQGPYMSPDEIEARAEELSEREGKDVELNFNMPRKIYSSFRTSGECDIDIYNFKSLEASWNPEHMLNNKDLMIIDWELDGPDGYSSTIEILKQAISSKQKNTLPFIIVYTAKPEGDFRFIVGKILENFNPFNKPRKEVVDLFCSSFILQLNGYLDENPDNDEVEDFLSQCSLFLFDYWRHPNPTAKQTVDQDIYNLINSKFGIKAEMKNRISGTFKRVMEATFGSSKDLLESLYYLSLDQLNDKYYYVKRINSKEVGFKVNNSIVCIFSKPGLEKDTPVEPDEVFESFSNLISKDPHNFLTLLSLEMRGRLNGHLLKIMEKMSAVDERAFFLHLAAYEQRSANFKNEFFDFLIKNWTSEIEAYNINQIPGIFKALDEYRKERQLGLTDIKQNEIHQELALLAAKLSTIKIENRMEKDPKIRFGDIFRVKNSDKSEWYFLCITPQCVCVDPDKVENNFYFIKSTDLKKDLKSTLDKIESEYYSLIRDESNEPLSINWGHCKPFTLWIKENSLGSLKSKYTSVDIELIYVTSLKENFAQRLANKAFNYGTSIGIDLPHLIKTSS